ncbi:hypothetical protein [Methylocella silvestris]|uniref:hypothetical protein n=1 Tax=Methylocella silvestris TaxID=199596 RepID=UPI00059E8648|nr:hypothetical protein [Methylocella silvestris]
MDTDFRVVDFDLIDDGTDIGASERRFAFEDVRAHDLCKGRDLVFCDADIWTHLCNRPVERDLRNITFGLYCGDPLFERRIHWVGNAVLDCSIETTQPSLRIGELCPESREAARIILVL